MNKIRYLISASLGPLALAVLVAGLAGMTACGSREIELPFETIEQGDWAGHFSPLPYAIRETRLVLVTSREETAQLEDWVSPEAMDQLSQLDFARYFAIALFRGPQASSGYDTIIERVARRDGKVVVYAQFWEPSPYYSVLDTVTTPYHVIKVRKDDGVGQEAELVLQSRAVTPTPPF
jgi:hypothetical protein